jgi:cellulose synthase/poly-beta-1,6-N-acetylglucosamine synthase-like glycosyltransferase
VKRLVRHFEDPAVGAAQGRCEISNARDSALTHIIALDYLAGYLVNEYGRQCLFALPAYGGANCAVRADMLRSLGGWNEESVTEDTDLTLRLTLSKARVRYDVTAVDDEEGVVTFRRFWRQRHRWARGHQKVWRDYRRAVWSSKHLSVAEKIETTMFLLVFHLPVISAVGLVILGLWFGGVVTPGDPLHASLLWTLLFLGPLLELGAGLLVARAARRDALALILFLPVFFVSIAICTTAWLEGIVGRPYAWVKTRRAADGLLEAA